MHQVEIAHVGKKKLNQAFKNKIGLNENANINKNI